MDGNKSIRWFVFLLSALAFGTTSYAHGSVSISHAAQSKTVLENSNNVSVKPLRPGLESVPNEVKQFVGEINRLEPQVPRTGDQRFAVMCGYGQARFRRFAS